MGWWYRKGIVDFNAEKWNVFTHNLQDFSTWYHLYVDARQKHLKRVSLHNTQHRKLISKKCNYLFFYLSVQVIEAFQVASCLVILQLALLLHLQIHLQIWLFQTSFPFFKTPNLLYSTIIENVGRQVLPSATKSLKLDPPTSSSFKHKASTDLV